MRHIHDAAMPCDGNAVTDVNPSVADNMDILLNVSTITNAQLRSMSIVVLNCFQSHPGPNRNFFSNPHKLWMRYEERVPDVRSRTKLLEQRSVQQPALKFVVRSVHPITFRQKRIIP